MSALVQAVRRRRPRSLRSRLVALLVALLVLGFGAALLVTAVGVRHVLLDGLDSQLRAAGDRFAVGLEHADRDADNPRQFDAVAGQVAGTLGARISHGRVTAAAVIAGHGATGRISPSARAVLAQLHATDRPHSITLPGLGTYRVLVRHGRDHDLQVTGLPVEPVEHTIGRLVTYEVLVFVAALLALAAVATVVVRLTLRPLGRVADTAAHVASLPLGSGEVSLPQRAPDTGTGSEADTVASAFNAMLEQVEAALVQRQSSEERLRRFLADASHELRTPVAVVRGHAEFAQRAGGDALPDDVRHALARIGAQSERMGHLVEDLLLLARLESGRPLARDSVDLTRVVLDAVDDARITAPDHRWQLHLPEDELVVAGDAGALHQVVANLLANARVHTPPGTTVNTTLRLDDDVVEIDIADDGPGVPDALRPRVFDRFVRGDARDAPRPTGTGSSGLGLPIVAAIVEAHRGRVELADTDEVTRGTRVVVQLPAGVPEDVP